MIPKCTFGFLIVLRYEAARDIHISLAVGHGEKLHDVPDEYLQDSLIVAKKIAVAAGLENYNILQVRSIDHTPLSIMFRQYSLSHVQNNGKIAHQVGVTGHLVVGIRVD